jgi:DNA polymerase III delta prime subunit
MTNFIQKYKPIRLHDFLMDADTLLCLQMIKQMTENVLLVGDPQTGKTSLLNALVHDLTVPVLHINSMHDQGLSYYRTTVKSFCQTPIFNHKKIIVIDDLDMLSEQIQQILRGLIDKYSHSIWFIASSCNVHKIVESIQTRFILVSLNIPVPDKISKLCVHVIQQENMVMHPDAIDFVQSISHGVVNNLFGHLEKLSLLQSFNAESKDSIYISLDVAMSCCCAIHFVQLNALMQFVQQKQIKEAVACIYDIFDQGYSVIDILDCMVTFIKYHELCTFTDFQKCTIIQVICTYISVFHIIHEDEIELSLFVHDLIQKV